MNKGYEIDNLLFSPENWVDPLTQTQTASTRQYWFWQSGLEVRELYYDVLRCLSEDFSLTAITADNSSEVTSANYYCRQLLSESSRYRVVKQRSPAQDDQSRRVYIADKLVESLLMWGSAAGGYARLRNDVAALDREIQCVEPQISLLDLCEESPLSDIALDEAVGKPSYTKGLFRYLWHIYSYEQKLCGLKDAERRLGELSEREEALKGSVDCAIAMMTTWLQKAYNQHYRMPNGQPPVVVSGENSLFELMPRAESYVGWIKQEFYYRDSEHCRLILEAVRLRSTPGKAH